MNPETSPKHNHHLAKDLIRVALKSAAIGAIDKQIITSPPAIDQVLSTMFANSFMASLNYLLQKLTEKRNTKIYHQPEDRPLVIAEVESFLITVNPLAAVTLINAPIDASTKSIAFLGLIIVNTSMLYAARALGTMMANGEGTDLQG